MGGDAGRSPRVRSSRQAATEDAATTKAKRRKVLIRVGAVAVVLLAALVGWKAIQNKRQLRARQEQAALLDREKQLQEMLQEAKNQVRQGNWEQAKAQFLALKETDPEFEAMVVQTYLTRADEEIPAERLLVEAEGLLKKSALGKAAATLAKVKTVNQLDRQAELKQKLGDAVSAKLGEARALTAYNTDLKKMEQLLALVEDVLAVNAEEREATELKKTAEDSIFRIKNPTVAPPKPQTPWIEVQGRYRSGDASGALALAQACANKFAKCRTLETQITDFEKKSKSVESLRDADLLSLYRLDKAIAGGSSSDLSKPIRTRIASSYYLKASSAKTTGNWSKAIDYARTVLDVDPGHPGAQSILADAQKQAKDIYLRAYQLKDNQPDDAIRFFKDVINMTPPDNEYHQKAKARLQELQR